MKTFLFCFFLVVAIGVFPIPSEGADCEKGRGYFDAALNLGNTIADLIQKEQLYRKVIEMCPSFAEACNNLGDVYEKQGRFEEAMAQYKKAIESKPTLASPYFGLGDIYFKTSRYAEAIKWYEKGLSYDPNNTLTKERITLARKLQEGGVIRSGTIRGVLGTAPLSTPQSSEGEGSMTVNIPASLIPFDFNRSDIKPEAAAQLNELGKALREMFPQKKTIAVEESPTAPARPLIEIAGHTDVRGTDEYNLALSEKRATSVVDYLVTNFGIPRASLIAVGYGERIPFCTTGDTEACHAMNRRVEIILKETQETKAVAGQRSTGPVTRGLSSGSPRPPKDVEEPTLSVDLGFFYQKGGEVLIRILSEGSRLRSMTDGYFLFLRSLQDCYGYVLQEDVEGNAELIFPGPDIFEATLKKGSDYWVPRFGRKNLLDGKTGEETLYLIVTSWPLKAEIEGLTLKDVVVSAARGLKTRIIKVVQPPLASQPISEEDLKQKPNSINSLLQRVEGKGGWVKVVKFWHE
jgi:outer membrane protein OmpA-like peptidoglycan-associated protein